jgi:hypothetical protein
VRERGDGRGLLEQQRDVLSGVGALEVRLAERGPGDRRVAAPHGRHGDGFESAGAAAVGAAGRVGRHAGLRAERPSRERGGAERERRGGVRDAAQERIESLHGA